MPEVVRTELMKLRRSPVPWATGAVMVLGVLGAALLTWIVRDPDRAASLGLLGAKANLVGLEATWPAFGSYVAVIGGAGGMVLLAFIVTFVVGREYVENMAKSMLVLPVPRWRFVTAKLAVTLIWWAALVALTIATGVLVGWLMGLPQLDGDTVATTVRATVVAAAASFLLSPVYAWITLLTRSYLATLGFAIGMLLLGNLLGHTGWASWFPWSIIALTTGIAGDQSPALGAGSVLVLVGTGAVALGGAVHRITTADNL